MSRRLPAIARVACLLTASTACLPAIAREGDVINLYAGLSFFRDDNIFRLPEGASILGSRADSIRVAFAGVTFDKLVSRQKFRGDFSYSTAQYGRFSFLDYAAPKIRLGWDWVVGNLWSGTISVDRSQVLTDFRDFRAPAKNITTSQGVSASANYQFHPDWTAQAGIDRTRSRNDLVVQQPNDFDGDAMYVGVLYRLKSGNQIGLRLRRTEGKYPNRVVVAGSTIDNSFRDSNIEARALWELTGKSRVDARVGYTLREHKSLPQRDFNGVTGGLTYDWTASDKSRLNVRVQRDIDAYDTTTTSFSDTRTVSVSPSWFPTAKTSLKGRVEIQNRDYKGDPGLALAQAAPREDRIRILGLTGIYLPQPYVQFSLGVQHDRRKSSDVNLDFTDTTWSASAQVTF